MSFYQKMPPKQCIGAVLAVIGAIFIIYAKHSMAKVEEANNFLDRLTNFFSHNPSVWNPLIKFFGGKAQEEASQYDPVLTLMFYLGIAFVVLGVWSLYWYRRRS